jgi:hypothetical protein
MNDSTLDLDYDSMWVSIALYSAALHPPTKEKKRKEKKPNRMAKI